MGMSPKNLECEHPGVSLARRELLRASSLFGLLALAGCGGGGGGGGSGTASAATVSASSSSSPSIPGLPTLGSFTQPVATTMAPAIAYPPITQSAPPPLTATSFKLISPVTGSNLPFCFGHAFCQGHVPSGSFALGTGVEVLDWQCTPLTQWPDGSLKHAIIAGIVTCSGTVGSPATVTVNFGTTTTAGGGTALTESDLATALGATSVTVGVGAQTITLNNLVSAAVGGTTPAQRTVCTGPVMSNWIYMQLVPGNAQLSVWFDVRLFNNGSVEIFPWVENGWLDPASALGTDTNYSVVCSVNVGATAVFRAQTLDLCNHTRIPLVSGTATQCSYWVGTNPQFVPQHDTAYLMATKLVPNYPFGISSTTPYMFTEAYAPNSLGDVDPAMASTGYETFIGILPEWCALHLAGGGDLRAYNYVIANGLAAGSWSVHYRDNTTNEVPTFIAYPNVSTNWGGSPTIPSSTGNVNQANGVSTAPDRAHQPSLAYYPWLLTARWFFLDELLLWNFWNYLQSNFTIRNGNTSTAASYVLFDGQIRARGWCFRTLAQALSAVPATHSSYQSLVNSWVANMSSYRARYVDGTLSGGAWKNALGCLGLYSGNGTGSSPYGTNGGSTTFWWDAPWMQATIIMSLGYAWDLGLPTMNDAQAKSDHQTVRDFGYSQVVGRAGPPNTAGAWDYRNFSQYVMPFSYPASSAPATWLPNWGAAYPVYEEYGGGNFSVLPALQPGDTTMYYGPTPLASDGSSWTTSSGTCFQMVALSYAVDHGATGAATGWQRIVTSASFSNAMTGSNGYPTNPLWAIYPRNPPP